MDSRAVQHPLRPFTVSPEMSQIISSVEHAGGSLLYVGGAVRDSALGLECKDIDLEVYGLGVDGLIKALEPYGQVHVVGSSFGVIKLTTETDDYDFSLPRRESKSGQGHRGFIVEPDPNMTPKEAASRRDFSFNAMAMTPKGELHDYFQGMLDLRLGVLRHTSAAFAEDPLRVLRGFQFAGRFNMRIDPTTAEVANDMKREYETISKERVWGEWEKWARMSRKPSAGMRVLQDTGWLDLFPEAKSLVGVPQEPEWHPEGDVWNHTLHVLDAAVDIANRDGILDEDRLVLVFAALAHDFGKPTTTIQEDGRWKSPGHAQDGMPLTVTFMNRIGAPIHLTEKVRLFVGEHMAHLNQITPRSVRRLALRLHPTNIELLGKLIEADHSGRPPLPQGLPKEARDMLLVAQELSLGLARPTPIVCGRHLMELARAGLIPEEYARGGPHYGRVLDVAFEAQLEGVFDSEDEGLLYAQRLLSPEYRDAVWFTGTVRTNGSYLERRTIRGPSPEGVAVETKSYCLRFSFDYGAGVCFWAANDAAEARFGYLVQFDDLPLSDETRRAGERLIERFETSLDWDDPARPSSWSEGDTASFNEATAAWLSVAIGQLGPGFEIVDVHAVPPTS